MQLFIINESYIYNNYYYIILKKGRRVCKRCNHVICLMIHNIITEKGKYCEIDGNDL